MQSRYVASNSRPVQGSAPSFVLAAFAASQATAWVSIW